MKLRKLEQKDAALMLEWMHDPAVNRFFRYDFASKTLADAQAFIVSAIDAFDAKRDYHFAVCEDDDTYLGTVSLKGVNREKKEAEYAISLRRAAQGRGVGRFATEAVLAYAYAQAGLQSVYLNVLADNTNAIRLYEKCGFRLECIEPNAVEINGVLQDLRWYRHCRGQEK